MITQGWLARSLCWNGLSANILAGEVASVVHGDLHSENMIFHLSRPEPLAALAVE